MVAQWYALLPLSKEVLGLNSTGAGPLCAAPMLVGVSSGYSSFPYQKYVHYFISPVSALDQASGSDLELAPGHDCCPWVKCRLLIIMLMIV